MKAVVDGREFDIDLSNLQPGRVLVIVNGEEREADIRRTADGAWSVLIGDDSWEIFVDVPAPRAADQETLMTVAGGRLHAVRLIDPRRAGPGGSAAHDHDGWAEIRAPMPGKVVAVLAEVGEAVEKGQGIVVVEAMKMENEFRAPKAGRLAEIAVAPGQAVDAGTLLAAVE